MTANPTQGWRIAPKTGAKLRRTEAGRFALALEITFNGDHLTDIEHIYTGEELEELYRQMRQLHADEVAAFQYEDRRQQKADMGQVF